MIINYDILIRLLVSLGLGAFLGFEREIRKCPAGLRTHTLVCIGATVFALASVAFSGPGVDISRIAGQVVVGIGFIGAGVIFKEKDKIVGLTTASTLWIAAGIGIMSAIGEFFVGIVVTVISIFVLSGGLWIEKYTLHKKKSRLKP
ncbi:MgtC/SapB family protein [Candidatus Woesearchaeota archaeon]|nr:MgtC/SapB family protein [Candidatus Woesearchaeota archaeon]